MANPQPMPTTYNVPPDLGPSLSSTGEYVGSFTRADFLVARTGAKGILFSFKSSTGAFAKYINLYTHNKAGNPTYGNDKLNAIMVCLKTGSASPKLETHVRWSDDLRQFVPQEIYVYPSLVDKEIGLLLQREEYLKSDASIGTSLGIVECFDPETRRSARELIDNTPAVLIDVISADLKDKLLGPPGASFANFNDTAKGDEAPAANAGDFDDDIPF